MKTPQEKKRLSLKKDHRNSYGESQHAARKSIPLRKALAHRSDRHKQDIELHKAVTATNEESLDIIDNATKGKRKNSWRKYADRPLGEQLAAQKAYKERREAWRLDLKRNRPAIAKQRAIETATVWFSSELIRANPPEYSTVFNLIYQDYLKGEVLSSETYSAIYHLNIAWKNLV